MKNFIKPLIVIVIAITASVSIAEMKIVKLPKVPIKVISAATMMVHAIDNDTGKGVANVPVYLDGKLAGQTKSNGTVLLLASPKSPKGSNHHTIKVQGSAVSYEDATATVDFDTMSDKIFKINKLYEQTIHIYQENYASDWATTNEPLYNALVYKDGVFDGGTDVDGKKIVKFKKGEHKISAEYKDPKDTTYGYQKPFELVNISKDGDVFFYFYAPRVVVFNIEDDCLSSKDAETALKGDVSVEVCRGLISKVYGKLTSPEDCLKKSFNMTSEVKDRSFSLQAIQPPLDIKTSKGEKVTDKVGKRTYLATVEVPTGYAVDVSECPFTMATIDSEVMDCKLMTPGGVYSYFSGVKKEGDKKIVSLYLTPHAEDIIYVIYLSKDGASKCGEEKSKEFSEGN